MAHSTNVDDYLQQTERANSIPSQIAMLSQSQQTSDRPDAKNKQIVDERGSNRSKETAYRRTSMQVDSVVAATMNKDLQ